MRRVPTRFVQKYTLRLAQLSVLHDGGVNDWSAADGSKGESTEEENLI